MTKFYLAQQADSWPIKIEKYTGKQSVHLTLQVTEDCCMACTYCYQHNKTPNKMTLETAKQSIDKILTLDQDEYSSLILEFIGGEPLMEVELIEQISEYTIDQLIKLKHPWIKYFKISICSNGLLYDTPRVQEFFNKYGDWVGLAVTLDGNEVLHDKCRLDTQGKGTYQRVLSNIKKYRDSCYGYIEETKMTISPDNLEYLTDAIINLIHEDFRYIYVNCIFEKGWEYSHATILYNKLKEIGDYLFDNDLYGKYYVRFFEESAFQPLDETANDNFCGGVLDKGYNRAIDYNGDVFVCIRYMNSSLNNRQKPLPIDNIYLKEITDEHRKNIDFLSNITRRSQSTDECFNCPIAAGCAWCSGYNYEEFGTPNKRATYICCMHKAASLANVYFINKVYRKLGVKQRFKMYLPKEEALKIINEDEYNYLLELSQEDYLYGI